MEQKEYFADFNTDNYANKLYYTIDNARLNTDKMISSCFYINVNNIWTNLILKLITAVTNYKNNIVFDQDIDLLIIIYINNNCLTPLNDWDKPNYFIVLFSTFFLFSTDGHFTPNKKSGKIKKSFNEWKKWALSHYSKQYNNYYILNVY